MGIKSIVRREIEALPARSVFCFGLGNHDGGRRRHRFVIANETLRLCSLIRSQVVCPAKAYRLIPELDLDVEWSGSISERHGVLHLSATSLKDGIARRIA